MSAHLLNAPPAQKAGVFHLALGMASRKYPVVLSSTANWKAKETDELKPFIVKVVYNDLEYDSFVNFYRNQKTGYYILSERKPKLKELTELSFWQKAAYFLPFKNQVSDVIVEAIKFTVTLLLGALLAKYTRL